MMPYTPQTPGRYTRSHPSGTYIPRRLQLQWHLTERCNLRCAHCYQDGYTGEDLPLSDLIIILAQYRDLLASWREEVSPAAVHGHVTVTGGEPFVRRDFMELLEILSSNRFHFSYAILTNGSLIDRAMAKRLRKLGPLYVQISIEGGKVTHDRIRGAGEYDRAVSALRHLAVAGINANISFTAHQENYREFPEVARLGRQLNAALVWADRLIPYGSGAGLGNQVLTPEQTHEFFAIMDTERRRAAHSRLGRTRIAMHRALQFLVTDGQPYHCTAGDELVTILANGDLCPCRRLPIPVGNPLNEPLVDLYNGSALFQELRDPCKTAKGCQDCEHAARCRGGLKCLSYNLTGDPFEADPGCWVAAG
jgi:radical SAM protein with 4Fe4S-binding SPASM domain